MMKIKDFFCLLAGVALLALAFQLKGLAEEVQPYSRHSMPAYETVTTESRIDGRSPADVLVF